MAIFNRVTIVGLGLIGGSLGMAIKQQRLARVVVGYSRKSSTLRQAKACRAIDVGTTDLRRAVCDADVVVLATPVDTIVPLATRAGYFMRPGSVLTDVGSVKAPIVRAVPQRITRDVAFIGAHPLAGSEQRGLAAARADLFDGSVCVITRTRQTDDRALQRVRRLWQVLARRVLVMSPQQHDRLLAAVSHLPHALAFALAGSVADGALAIAPRSFLDATRVAQSDADLWDDILIGNRNALLAAMARFDRQWRSLRTYVAHGRRAALRQALARAQSKLKSSDKQQATRDSRRRT